ncbi:MAG: anthranilate synthase component I family protein [Bacteroidota bacterium]
MRKIFQKQFYNSLEFKQRLLTWAQQFDQVIWLDSNDYKMPNSSYDAVLAVDALTAIQTDYHDAFKKLQEYQTLTKDWIFGYLSYDLKNDVEELRSENYDGLDFPDLFFFQPKKLFFLKGNCLEAHYLDMVFEDFEADLKEIEATQIIDFENSHARINVEIESRISRQDYIDKVELILNHIHRGDIYETNFCQEFYAENALIDPLEIYLKLNSISTPPFASFLKNDSHYALTASPERYLRKERQKVLSQPIKGTAKRSKNIKEDQKLREVLSQDSKERSENIMIVDLVRNDLAKTAQKGSVQVEELCKIYSFEQVHQMISTVASKIDEFTHPVDILKTTFPMGSMTGAPKISAMEIVENFEETKRGLYSGAIGYFSPNGDFDFNVVIRSILYNFHTKYASISVGSAITAMSIPEKEYEECFVKLKAMRDVLNNEL